MYNFANLGFKMTFARAETLSTPTNSMIPHLMVALVFF